MITIIDAGGNLGSLSSALEKIGAEYEVACQVSAKTTHVILPGVGRADTVMAKLRNYGLTEVIPNLKHPVLGICVGFHVLCKSSEEGPTECMGVFPYRVQKLPQTRFGWEHSHYFDSYMYFCHQYAVFEPRCGAGEHPVHLMVQENFTGVQFHPEKSGNAGLEFLRDWYRNTSNESNN